MYRCRVKAYEQAFSINPKFSMELADAWNNFGNNYRDSGKIIKAITAYEQAIGIDPEFALAWFNLGFAYGKSGKMEQVTEVYKQLKTLDPAMADHFFEKVILP